MDKGYRHIRHMMYYCMANAYIHVQYNILNLLYIISIYLYNKQMIHSNERLN